MLADVALVPMQESHVARTYAWLQSAELRRQIDSLAAPTESGNVTCWHNRRADATREDYAVEHRGEHLGNCGLGHIDLARRKAELWIYLGERSGNGAGRAAVTALLARAFDGLHLNRVYLRVLATNPRAIRFYEALGFTTEGRLRDDSFVEGAPVDSFAMSILAREHATQRGPA